MSQYLPVKGEIPISKELQTAVATLIEHQHRGTSAWIVRVSYRFDKRGIQVRTNVQAAEGSSFNDFTELETIAIAAALNNQPKQQENS